MNKLTVYLLITVLIAISVPPVFAQQNQNTQEQEVETLKKQVLELQKQLQTVENVEKMELAAKLAEAQAKHADAHAKLIETEFDKLKLELKDSNQQWLITWIIIFLAFLSAGGLVLWSRLTKKMDDLIATEVEKRVNRFQEAVEQVDTLKYNIKEAFEQVNILQAQLRILNKEHAASVLEHYRYFPPEEYPQQIKELEEQAILDVFSDETRHLEFRRKAVEILAHRKSTRLVSHVLDCLNSYIYSDSDWYRYYQTQHILCNLVEFIGYEHTTEIYETFERFLEQLLSEKQKEKRFIITSITFSLVYLSSELNKDKSISVIRDAIPYLIIYSEDENALKDLAEYFDKFQEHESIKEILTNGLTDGMPDVEEKCLELLEKHDPDFVKEWKAQKATTNTENEESS